MEAMAVPSATSAAAAAPVPALYVGDLDAAVEDGHLFELFSSIGAVASVRVCRDSATGRSLGYGYINYISSQDAMVAIEKLNHTQLNGKPIRIMWSHRDPDSRNSGIGNIFVKNLSNSVDNATLHELFSRFGTILSCKVAVDEGGKSRGYGFVQFNSQESADNAIENLNDLSFEGKKIYVAKFIKRSERVMVNREAKFTNLYMKNLDQDITEELIRLKFKEYGKIVEVSIATDDKGNSKGFGFVCFESPDSAKKAMEAMNGLQLAQKKAERAQMLRRLYEEKRNEQIRKYMASNVYVKNLNDVVDDNILHERFSECGNITSAKVMRDEKGLSKGFGFVCYSSPEEANKAVNALHGCMFYGKPLYVALAQRKEDRRTQLQLQFAQRMAGLAGSPAAIMPAGYSPVYYAPPGVVSSVPPRQGLVYQSFGMRPGWRPNGFVPQSRPAFQPMPLNVMPGNHRQHRQNRGRVNGNMLPQTGYIPHLQQPNVLLNSSKDVIDQHFDLAAKITGMLLEMDNSEMLLLLESPESLATKVDEAVEVLKLSKTKTGGQENMSPNFLISEVAVN